MNNVSFALRLTTLALAIGIGQSACQKSDPNNTGQGPQPVPMQQVGQTKLAPSHESAAPATTTPGSKKIDFVLKDLDGKDLKFADYAGKVVIVDFWATWCGPCVKEIPEFVELQKEYGAKGFQMIGISVDQQGPDVVRKFIAEKGVNYINAMVTPEVASLFQAYDGQPINGIPTTYIINQKGEIHKKLVGMREKSEFEAEIKALLSAS